MLGTKFDLREFDLQKTVSKAIKNNDYSGYGFGVKVGALEADDAEVLMILLTVAKFINCKIVKKQITESIRHNQLKEMLIQDVLMEADETFFDNRTIAKTLKNIYKIEETELIKSFTEIAETLNY